LLPLPAFVSWRVVVRLQTPSPTSAPTTGAPTTAAEPTTTSATTAACEDAAALRSSLEALTKIQPTREGVEELKSAIADVRTRLDAAEASAPDVLQPDIQEVMKSFADLQTAASGLSTDNARQKAPAIAAALKQLASATQALATTLRETCPGI
jgi:hypothetical protein